MEFKEAGRDFDTDRIGRYVCALSNVVNLGEAPAGLLVFGVKNKTHSVGGTDYRSVPPRLNGIKAQVTDGTEPGLTFRSVRIVDHSGCRVVLFEVPPAPQGMPFALLKTSSTATSGDGIVVDYQESLINTNYVPYMFRFNWNGPATSIALEH